MAVPADGQRPVATRDGDIVVLVGQGLIATEGYQMLVATENEDTDVAGSSQRLVATGQAVVLGGGQRLFAIESGDIVNPGDQRQSLQKVGIRLFQEVPRDFMGDRFAPEAGKRGCFRGRDSCYSKRCDFCCS